MSKELKISLFIFLIIVAAALAAITFFVITENRKEEAASNSEQSEVEKLANSGEKFVVKTESENGLPSERAFSEEIHHMTHQKVQAEQKWGHLEITDERIEDMLETTRQSDYRYKDFYIEALEEWQAGEFDNAVEVHNVIWEAHDGNTGKAHDLLTPQEETKYKNAHFN